MMVKASPLRLRAARAPDAMDVILRMLRHVVVDDVAHVRDVQPARGNVRGHQHLKPAGAEALQRLFALLLRAVRVQHGHGVIVALEQAHDAVGPVLRPAKDQHRVVIHALQQFEQQVGFLLSRKRDK